MTERVGCDKHPVFDALCLDCWNTDDMRLRTFVERVYRARDMPYRFKKEAIKILRGTP